MSESSPYIEATSIRPPTVSDSPETGLRYVWRSIKVVWMFAWFGGACVGLALWAGVLRLVVRSRTERVRRLRSDLSAISRRWVRFAINMGGMSLPVSRHEPAAPASKRGCLVIANHPTIMDVILLWAELPNVCCVMKADLERMPLLRPLMGPLDYLSNSDPEALLNDAASRLRRGETLLVFPEATRTTPGQPLSFRLGAAEMALRAGADTLPIVIHHDGSYLRKGQSWFDFPRGRVDFGLTVGPRQAIDEQGLPLGYPRQARRQLTQRWQAHCQSTLDQPVFADISA